MEAFLAVVDAGSLSSGARRLSRSLQSVSRSLMGLEAELGVMLISRTTRTLHVTPAGERYGDRVRLILEHVQAARDELLMDGAALVGRLRVSAPPAYGAAQLMPALSAFMKLHPEVALDLHLSDHFVDLADAKVDLAIRFGELADSELMARRIGQVSRVVCASPAYLERHGSPTQPRDLLKHRCVTRDNSGYPDIWRLGKNDPIDLPIVGTFRSDDSSARISAIVNGMGIGRIAVSQIEPLIAEGHVVVILSEFTPAGVPISLVWQQSRMSGRLRALIDHLSARLSE